MPKFPGTRLRRNRKATWSRELFAENYVKVSDLIMPLFVMDGNNLTEKITYMDGIYRYSIDKLVDEAKSLYDLGIKAVILFPYIAQNLKTLDGKAALDQNGIICKAIAELKRCIPQLGVIVDVALDPYTSHGHDGIVNESGYVDNDETLKLLAKQSLIIADAGADALAPSDMMDGRIGYIRNTLENHHHYNVQLFAYSAKYASNFYSPFRHAVGSFNNLGQIDKKSYQIDYRNSKEALLEISMDIEEGADAVIIKPGMMYLDIVKLASEKYNIPIISYQVSGEYAMLRNAAKSSIIMDEKASVLEMLCCCKRAGASAIITYHAKQVAEWFST